MPGYPRPRATTPRTLADLAALVAAVDGTNAVIVGADRLDDGIVDPLDSATNWHRQAVTGITHASDEVRPGDLFAALPGANAHGSRFVAAAESAGAVAVLTDTAGRAAARAAGLPALVVADPRGVLGAVASAIYGDPSRRLTIVGLTGTAGKSSTAYLVESGLRAAGHTTGLIGTVETRLGDIVIDSVRTTPEATDLQALFAVAVERGVTSMVMEVSSHALALGRVDGTRFAVGGYTNFGSDHLDFHADVADYFAAKALLFDGRCDVEVLNGDDPALVPLRRPATVTYSAAGDTAATWYATDATADNYEQYFLAHGPAGLVLKAGVAMPGRHNIANALLAIASLAAIGVDPQTAANGVAACLGIPGRLERVHAPGGVIGVVDYAHKADAIVAALAALREMTGGRLICVLGAGGDRDRQKRPVMGGAAARGSDLLIVTDDNPRTEDPAVIRAEVLRGAVAAGAGAEIVEVDGRRAAITEAVRRAADGDVIALLGKGHERGQEIRGETHPFDDRIELSAALTERARS